MIFMEEHPIGRLNSYSGFTFHVQLLLSLHVYAISEVNAYTPVLVISKSEMRVFVQCSYLKIMTSTLAPH